MDKSYPKNTLATLSHTCYHHATMSQSNKLFKQHLNQLKKTGSVITPIRQAILNILCQASQPLTVRHILSQLGLDKVKAHRATVYRDIEFLTHHGLVNCYALKDQSVLHYEIVSDHHHHIVCESCGHVENILPQNIEVAILDYQNTLKKQKNFAVTSHRLKFYGICSTCISKKES